MRPRRAVGRASARGSCCRGGGHDISSLLGLWDVADTALKSQASGGIISPVCARHLIRSVSSLTQYR